MHRAVYMVLLAASSLAHYQIYDRRHLIQQQELEPVQRDLFRTERLLQGFQENMAPIPVECPVCEDKFDSMYTNDEECETDRISGKRYKICKYGAYRNDKCGSRLDCYRGAGEKCSHKMSLVNYGHLCAHGYTCNSKLGRCTGIGYFPDPNILIVIEPNIEYPVNRSISKTAELTRRQTEDNHEINRYDAF